MTFVCWQMMQNDSCQQRAYPFSVLSTPQTCPPVPQRTPPCWICRPLQGTCTVLGGLGCIYTISIKADHVRQRGGKKEATFSRWWISSGRLHLHLFACLFHYGGVTTEGSPVCFQPPQQWACLRAGAAKGLVLPSCRSLLLAQIHTSLDHFEFMRNSAVHPISSMFLVRVIVWESCQATLSENSCSCRTEMAYHSCGVWACGKHHSICLCPISTHCLALLRSWLSSHRGQHFVPYNTFSFPKSD